MSTWLGDPGAPADEAEAVTASDVTTFPASRALYVGVGGSVAVTMADAAGTQVTFAGVPAGAVLPIRITQVRATGTVGASSFVVLR